MFKKLNHIILIPSLLSITYFLGYLFKSLAIYSHETFNSTEYEQHFFNSSLGIMFAFLFFGGLYTKIYSGIKRDWISLYKIIGNAVIIGIYFIIIFSIFTFICVYF